MEIRKIIIWLILISFTNNDKKVVLLDNFSTNPKSKNNQKIKVQEKYRISERKIKDNN